MSPPAPSLARLAATLGGRLPGPGQRIGLLGGSFNPVHPGHRHISREALRRLGLDQIWWLISPQNPLKSSAETAPLDRRLAAARSAAGDPRIRAAALETALGTAYTAHTLAALIRRFPRVGFVWLMGADNLVQVSDWRDWPDIFEAVTVAVFDRAPYSLKALAATAARRYARYRLAESGARTLAARAPPAWVFIHHRLNPRSSTGDRAAGSLAGARLTGREIERSLK